MAWIVAVAAVVGTAYSIYKSENAPDMPQMPAPPKPASYYNEQYDENGNLIVTEQVWDEKRNAYVTKHDPEPAEPPKPTAKPTAKPTSVGVAPNQNDPKYWGGVDPLSFGDDTGSRTQKAQDYWYDKGREQYQADSMAYSEAQSGAAAAANAQADSAYQAEYADWQEKHDAWAERKAARKASAAEQKAEKALRQEIRTKILGELDKTPEERLVVYADYAKTLSDAMHTDVDKRYEETQRASEESMAQRGMTGSRTAVDINKELTNEKEKADVDIAQRAELAKYSLGQADRDFNLRTLANLDAGESAENALQYQKQRDIGLQGLQATANANSSLMSAYSGDIGNRFDKWKYDVMQNQAAADRYMNTSQGLAYLYGYNNKGGTTNTIDNSGFNNPNYRYDYRTA